MSGRSIKQLLRELRDFVNHEVAAGFAGPEAIVHRAVNRFFRRAWPALLLPVCAEGAVKSALAKHLEAQAKWPATTDCDRLDSAFAELEQKGIFCRQNTGADGQAAIEKYLTFPFAFGERPDYRGYVFFHAQDTEFVLKHGLLFLTFGPVPVTRETLDAGTESRPDESSRSEEIKEATLAVAREVVETLKRHGLDAQWNGLPQERIRVPMVWKRRREADQMDRTAEMPRRIKETVADHDVSVVADDRCILETGPVEVIDGLIDEGLPTEEEEPDEDAAAADEAMTSKPTEQIVRDMSIFIDRQVAAGFAAPDEIADGAVRVFSGDVASQTLRPIAEELIKRAVENHLKEQETWPAVTDCDRLDSAFAELERHGILCRQNYGSTDGHAELEDETLLALEKGRVLRGYCFYVGQDTDKAIESGSLFLAFGPGPVAEEEMLPVSEERIRDVMNGFSKVEHVGTAVAREIVATLQYHGLNAQWSGSIMESIQIQMDWKRWRHPQTPEE